MAATTLLVVFAMLLLNAVFAAYELALASVSMARLRALAERHAAGAMAALRMRERMEASLAVVQVGITLVGAIAAATGGVGADETLSPWMEKHWGLSSRWADALALLAVVLPLSAVTIVVGELVPKAFAMRNAEWVCLRLSPLMRGFAMSVYPVMVTFEWLTQRAVALVQRRVDRSRSHQEPPPGLNELLAQARLLRVSRLISPEQERVIEGADRLTRACVADIMVPAGDIRTLEADGRLTHQIIIVHMEAHTRFLVTERSGDPQGIIGYVNVKDIFFLAKTHPENPTLRAIIRPVLAMESTAAIGTALQRMMAEHAHLALVRDTAGRVAGMITLEDIIEEVVGDIGDEYDRLPRTLTRSGKQWLAGGGLPMSRLREELGRPALGGGALPAGTASSAPAPPSSAAGDTSVHDWLAAARGQALAAGDAFEVGGVRVLVRKVRRGKVMEALLDVEPGTP